MLKNPVFKFFASLKLAVFSLLSLAAVLAYGTVAESLYGMRAAHVLVYGAWWFYGVLILLGTNVICAAFSRYPWKKHQTGFVITHAGIITILVGSFLTAELGVDGNLPVQEQTQDNDVILNDLKLTIEESSSGTVNTFPFKDSAVRTQGEVMKLSLPNNQGLLIDDYLPRLVVEKKITPDAAGSPFIQFRLSNSRMQLEEWLTTTHPSKPSELNLGPATITFETLWNEKDKEKFFLVKKNENTQNNNLGELLIEFNGEEYKLTVDPSSSTWKRIGNSGLEARIEKYFSYAIVEGNDLVNKSEETANPAVQLFVRNGGNHKQMEKHTAFANFPEFNTLHKAQLEKKHQKELGVHIRYQFPDRKELAFVGMKRGKLMLAYTFDDKKIYFRAFGADGRVKSEGEIHPKQELPVGWMDMKLEIPQWFPNGVEVEEPRYIHQLSGGESNFLAGVHVVPIVNGQPQPKQAVWLIENYPEFFKLGTTQLKLSFGKERKKLPFYLFLDKFTIGTNPGTQKAASFESNVSVRDPAQAVPTKSLISMNSPLVYGGYTFYQASYQMAEGMPAVSVFAVNYDPGRWVKYFGSLIMVVGAALMFYMNPHYWSILLGSKKRG